MTRGAPGPEVGEISSRDNPLLKRIRRLAAQPTAYREAGQIWVEGDHLCRAAMDRGIAPAVAVVTAEAWRDAECRRLFAGAGKVAVVTPALFASLSGLESPVGMGALVDWGAPHEVQPGLRTVVLDGVQDAGNVGSILRSAAAFGFGQIIALKGTAALWSPKVLRAGMGAHFALRLVEGVEPDALDALTVPVVVTSSHTGSALQEQKLPMPCAWALGHEGQGVGAALMARASLSVRIEQPGGEESLNVAAAAAICLHASAVAATSGQPQAAAPL